MPSSQQTPKRPLKTRLKRLPRRIAAALFNVLATPFYTLVLGPKMKVRHIWPPKNYRKRYSALGYRLIYRPMEERGIYIPQQSPRDGSAFNTFHNEHRTIDAFVQARADQIKRHFVDIGAGNGIDMSNTYLLAANGWRGLSIEIDANNFARMAVTYQHFSWITLLRTKVTPHNVNQLLAAADTPREFGVLNLDIDGYDYYVLREILEQHRPMLIVAEINANIPASVCFSVSYSDSFSWKGNSFFGMSLAMLSTLADEHGYTITDARGGAAFLTPAELCGKTPQPTLDELDARVVATTPHIDRDLRKTNNSSPERGVDYVVNTLLKGEQMGNYVIDVYPASSGRR